MVLRPIRKMAARFYPGRGKVLPDNKECKPDFLCIGAQKAGTSWLFMQLQSHPGVFLPPLKELHYFDHLFVPRNRKWTTWHIKTSVRRLQESCEKRFGQIDEPYRIYLERLANQDLFTDSWYREAFRRPAAKGRIKGDITPEYCTLPEEGVEFVQGNFGPLKIIYILRDPLARALSQLRMNAQRRKPGPSTDAEWLELAQSPEITNRGDYASYIPRWRARFPEKDLLFLPFGKIRSDPERVMRDVEQTLGVKAHDYHGLGRRVHATEPVSIPEAAVDFLRSSTRQQTEFLEQEFPSDFIANL